MSEYRNKPEKLTLSEISKRNPERKDQHQLPFKIQLQKMKSDAENQLLDRLLKTRKNLIRQLETIRKSKVIVYHSIGMLKPNDFEIIFELVNTTGKQDKLDLYLLSSGGLAHPACTKVDMWYRLSPF